MMKGRVRDALQRTFEVGAKGGEEIKAGDLNISSMPISDKSSSFLLVPNLFQNSFLCFHKFKSTNAQCLSKSESP